MEVLHPNILEYQIEGTTDDLRIIIRREIHRLIKTLEETSHGKREISRETDFEQECRR